jgi:thiamine biosynthesis lipoprotein
MKRIPIPRLGLTAAIAAVAFGLLFLRMTMTPPRPAAPIPPAAPETEVIAIDPTRPVPPGGLPVGTQEDFLRGTLVAMGGVPVVVTVFGESSVDRFNQHLAAVEELTNRLEDIFSGYRPDSPVSRLNRGGGELLLSPGPEFLEVLRIGLDLQRRSGGAFDMTVRPLIDLWRRAAERGTEPTEEELREVRSRIGADKIEHDETRGTVRLSRAGMGLDFGGLAKGYIVDRAVDLLRQRGVRKGIVNAGGDLRAFAPAGALTFRIGLRDPEGEPEDILGVFQLRTGAVATSGIYERYFVIGERRYGHLVDPRSGMPAQGVLSATVRADDAMRADGLATAVFILGPEEGMRLVEEVSDAEAVILYRDGGRLRQRTSAGMEPVEWIGRVSAP